MAPARERGDPPQRNRQGVDEMQEPRDERTLEQVLLDFEVSCPRPSVEDVERLIALHPDYAAEIVRSASLTAMEILTGRDAVEPRIDPRDEAFVSSMVDAFMASRKEEAKPQRLDDLLKQRGISVEGLEEAVAIRPGVLGPVMTEGLRGPVPRPLANAVAAALRVSPEQAAASLAMVPRLPVWEHATSGRAPRRRLRSFAEAIRDTDMPEGRKAFWLGDD